MLITCPACGARYEVDAALIPPAGRTVRCSACRAEWTWRPDPAREAAPTRPPESDEPPAPAPTPGPEAPAARRTGMTYAPAARRAATTGAVTPVAPAPPRAEAAMIESLDEDAAAPGGRSGAGAFMAGFAVVALLALGAVMIYAQRAEIAAAAPALAPWVEAYAALVERLRAILANLAAGVSGGG